MTISFTLNGETVAAEIKPHHNLVEVLQREFNLMGARESCGQGMCGCCTVLVNGAAVSGCLYLAAFVDGAEVQTVESLADPRTQALSPVQERSGTTSRAISAAAAPIRRSSTRSSSPRASAKTLAPRERVPAPYTRGRNSHFVMPGLDPGIHRERRFTKEDGLQQNSGLPEFCNTKRRKSGRPDLRCQARQ